MTLRTERKIIHLHDKLQEDLLEVLDDLFYFSINNYDKPIMKKTNAIYTNLAASATLQDRIFPQLVWWIMFCYPVEKDQSIFQKFLGLHQQKWKRKGQAFHDTLASWQLTTPGFYMTETVGESKRVYKLIDIFGLKRQIACIYNKIYQPAEYGEMLSGILLPFGDDTYISPVDFFHIPSGLAPQVAWEVITQFNQHAVSSNYYLNPHLYPRLLTAAIKTVDKNSQKIKETPYQESLN